MKKSGRTWATAGLGEAAHAALAQGLPATEVWSLLLDVIEQRAGQRTPARVLQQWESDRFVSPAQVDQRTFNEIDSHLLAAAQGFDALELSPLAPLGACSAVALTSQNRIVPTVRGTEVVSDPTNVLALESVRRLRENPQQIVKLATSHRCVRAQEVPKRPGFAAHFRMFCMTTAGHERENQSLVTDALIEHIRTHLAALDRLEQHGYDFPARSLRILSTPERAQLAQRIADAIQTVPIVSEPLGHEYYDGLRFMIHSGVTAGATACESIPLIDGGAFDWLRKLSSNRKLTFVASAIGSQLVAFVFRRRPIQL